MDNELSNSMVIAVELIVLSAVIGIIMLFAGIGQQFQRSTVASVSDVVSSAYDSEITALGEYMEPVPVATVYLVIERNPDLVRSVTGTIHGNSVASKGDLMGYFGNKVTVTVTEVKINGVGQKKYDITVGG